LENGDVIRTYDGSLETVEKIHSFTSTQAPWCLKAHSVAFQCPSRDILLSPDHAIYVPKTKITRHIKCGWMRIADCPFAKLTNAKPNEIFHYYHFSLASKSPIIIHGMKAETLAGNLI
jgi:hypothetical protein